MTETAAERRARILARATDTYPWEYDLALDLGYQPERWDGMWKLPIHPFSVRFGHVVVREVVLADEVPPPGHVGRPVKVDGEVQTRLRVYPLPEGWNLICDQRITEAEPRYVLAKAHPDSLWVSADAPSS